MSNKSFELQNQIRQTTLRTQGAIRDLKKWEEEAKQKEIEFQKQKENLESSLDSQKLPPVRSKVEEFQQYAKDSANLMKSMSIDEGEDNKTAEEQSDLESKKQEAVSFKDKGNTFVKAKDYESALKMYTRAIELYDKDPVFFSNRSQCYLSLEKYQECIQDATKAIELDPKSAKSFYRRMTAYEKLGEDYKALQSCHQWLDLAPEDTSAKNSYDRIHNRIAEVEKKKDKEKIRWARLRPSSQVVSFVNRPPHLRSKKPMKNVSVELMKAASPIPESVIDRIFDNNTGEAPPETNSKLFKTNFLASPKPQMPTPDVKAEIKEQVVDEKKKLNEQNENLKATELPALEKLVAEKVNLIAVPISCPQFVAAWKELGDIDRFLYLKNIVESNAPIGKLIGAQLNSEILSELIQILHKFFMPYNLPFIKVLSDLRENSEINILVMFLEGDDKTKLNELLSSAASAGDNATNNLILEIRKFFQI